MSGPYRDNRNVETPSPVRFAREKASTRRVVVRSAPGGELVVRLQHHHRWAGTLLLLPVGVTCCVGAISIMQDRSLDSPLEHGLWALGIGVAMFLGGVFCIVAREELAFTRNAFVRRHGSFLRGSEVVLLADVDRFKVERTKKGHRLLLEHGKQTLPLMHEDNPPERLSDGDLAWLAERLRKALESLREAP